MSADLFSPRGGQPTESPRPSFGELTLDLGDLLLRPFCPDDLPGIVAACSDPLTQRWLALPTPYGPADARRYLESQVARRESGDGVTCAIARSRDNSLIGSIGVKQTNWRTRVTDIGYWARSEERGRGAITRATRALSRWALDQGMERVELRCAPANLESNRVAAGAGFSFEGVMRNAGIVHAGRVDLNLYSFIRADRDRGPGLLPGPDSPE